MIARADESPTRADERVVLRRLAGGGMLLCIASVAERAYTYRGVLLGMRALIDIVAYWSFWMALAPMVVSMTRRIDRRPAMADRVIRHVLAAAALMLCHSAALYWVQRTTQFTDLDLPVWWGALDLMRWRLTGNLLAYVSIVAVTRFSDAERVANARQQTAMRLSEQLSAAQLEALRLQLNPHFLFNSLNTVAMLVRRGAATDAVRAITRLAELLRQLLRTDGAQFVSLREELSLLDRYLELERLRFGDRLRVVHDIDDAALDACVPPFLLQPIVENSIRHGIGRLVSGGTLHIVARRAGAQLQIEIADDGPGMDENGTHPAGVGLANTVGRLGELYGSAFEFDIRSMPGATIARIAFPAKPMTAAIRSAS